MSRHPIRAPSIPCPCLPNHHRSPNSPTFPFPSPSPNPCPSLCPTGPCPNPCPTNHPYLSTHLFLYLCPYPCSCPYPCLLSCLSPSHRRCPRRNSPPKLPLPFPFCPSPSLWPSRATHLHPHPHRRHPQRLWTLTFHFSLSIFLFLSCPCWEHRRHLRLLHLLPHRLLPHLPRLPIWFCLSLSQPCRPSLRLWRVWWVPHPHPHPPHPRLLRHARLLQPYP
mmetsp:Transcript_31917/g.85395  ORF Transcript_31917/g.85395 Transcript_31917/m.85395 type:complete len:221 (+) Transcript_31917:492-1154(+)